MRSRMRGGFWLGILCACSPSPPSGRAEATAPTVDVNATGTKPSGTAAASADAPLVGPRLVFTLQTKDPTDDIADAARRVRARLAKMGLGDATRVRVVEGRLSVETSRTRIDDVEAVRSVLLHGRLSAVALADDVDSLGPLRTTSPPGITVIEEVVSHQGSYRTTRFAATPLEGNRNVSRDRLATWLSKAAPSGTFVYGVTFDTRAGQALIVRSYAPGSQRVGLGVVRAEPFLDDHARVAVTLDPESGKRFADFTRATTGSRVAILVDDWVEIAPVVQEAITGGTLVVSTGTTGATPDPTVVEKTQRLATILGLAHGGPPLELVSEEIVDRP